LREVRVSPYTVKKCRNAPNSDADNGGAEPNDVGVGIFRSPCRFVRATVVHIDISQSFFYSVETVQSPSLFSLTIVVFPDNQNEEFEHD
jgi:hypothetical protein